MLESICFILVIAFVTMLFINNKQNKEYHESLSRIVNQQPQIRYPVEGFRKGGNLGIISQHHPLDGVTFNEIFNNMVEKRKRHKEKITMRKRIRGNRKVVDVKRKMVKVR